MHTIARAGHLSCVLSRALGACHAPSSIATQVLSHDRNSPYPGQLCCDINLLCRDKRASALGPNSNATSKFCRNRATVRGLSRAPQSSVRCSARCARVMHDVTRIALLPCALCLTQTQKCHDTKTHYRNTGPDNSVVIENSLSRPKPKNWQ